MMNKQSFEFVLNNPTTEIKKLVLFSPTNIHRPLTAPMQSMLMKVLRAEGENSKNIEVSDAKGSAELDGESLVTMLMMAKDQDEEFYFRFYDRFEALILSANICKINDLEKKLEKGHLQMMNQDDTDKLMGEYLTHFLLPSVISQTQN